MAEVEEMSFWSRPLRQGSRALWLEVTVVVVAVALGVTGVMYFVDWSGLKPGCDIKGNISYNTGESIYHTPGGDFYDRTQINLSKGERWFCSEEEAEAAGWRRSKR